ncbi:family 1 glycosylhydrolase [Paenibacillus sp. MABNR03]
MSQRRNRCQRLFTLDHVFDNFEWQAGYSMTFGLIEVDRATQETEA